MLIVQEYVQRGYVQNENTGADRSYLNSFLLCSLYCLLELQCRGELYKINKVTKKSTKIWALRNIVYQQFQYLLAGKCSFLKQKNY